MSKEQNLEDKNKVLHIGSVSDGEIPSHKRKEGYYWVKYKGDWLIVYSFHNIEKLDNGNVHHQYWWEINDCEELDEDFDEIDEKTLVR